MSHAQNYQHCWNTRKINIYYQKICNIKKSSFHPHVLTASGKMAVGCAKMAPGCAKINKGLPRKIADKCKEPYTSVINCSTLEQSLDLCC